MSDNLINLNGRLVKPANAEMVEGFLDGYDLNAPEPSSNRSHSYRHGFRNGRADKIHSPRPESFDEILRLADEAMTLDLN